MVCHKPVRSRNWDLLFQRLMKSACFVQAFFELRAASHALFSYQIVLVSWRWHNVLVPNSLEYSNTFVMTVAMHFKPGPCFNIMTIFPGLEVPIIKIRWPWDKLTWKFQTSNIYIYFYWVHICIFVIFKCKNIVFFFWHKLYLEFLLLNKLENLLIK